MKHIIPISAIGGGNIARCLPAHYSNAGWHDFDPTSSIPHTAILEIDEVALSHKEIMEEPKPIQVAQIYDQEQNPMNGRVYSEDGISPTLRTPTGGLSEPCILTPVRTQKAKELRRQGVEDFSSRELVPRADKVSNTITTVQKDNLLQEPIKIRQATSQGYAECPAGGGFDAAYSNSKLRRGRVQGNGDVVGAITASADGHCVYEGAEVSILGYTRDDKGNVTSRHEKETAGTLHTSTGSGGNTDQFVKEPMIQPLIPWNRPGEPQPISPTITTNGWQDNNVVIEPNTVIRYRIRKLTERECFRLMDVSDSDIDKIEAHRIKVTLKNGTVKEKPIPKSAKYKLAGNSIVVSCLYHIFHQMFIAEPPEPQPIQLSLFDL